MKGNNQSAKNLLVSWIGKNNKKTAIFLSSLIVVLLFQNCMVLSPQNNSSDAGLDNALSLPDVPSIPMNTDDDTEKVTTGDKCEDIYLEEYIRPEGYYKFLTKNCASCHDGKFADRPAFASANKLIAFKVFKEKEILGGESISSRAISSHQPGLTGVHHAGVIQDFKTGFAPLKSAYQACKGVVSVDYSLQTSAQTLAAAISPKTLTTQEQNDLKTEKGLALVNGKIITTDFKLNPYERLVYDEAAKVHKKITLKKYTPSTYWFDLSASTYTKSKAGDEPAMLLSVELAPSIKTDAIKKTIAGKTYVVNYTQTLHPYLVLSKPVFKFKTDPKNLAWQFKGLSIYINGSKRSDATVYNILNARICGRESIGVMTSNNSQILVFNKLNTSDKITLKFDEALPTDATKITCTRDSQTVDLPLPTAITWTELTKAGVNGVFFRNCLGCHNAINASAGLDLSTWENAKARSSIIISRIDDANNPMPRGGMMDDRSRKLVKLWINKGTPK